MARFYLLHSPVVGPSTWKWVAEELRGSGHDAEILVSTPASTTRGWEGVVEEAVAQAAGHDDAVFVAHSGAGPLLPTIVERSESRGSTLVFVDAGVPAVGEFTPLMPEALLHQLSDLAVAGVLPPWSEWFGSDVLASLVPDASKRELIESELPRIPLAYFFGSVPPVREWPADRNGYVLLSDAYVDDAEEARRRHWPVVEVLGGHLDLVTKAPDVAAAIVRVTSPT